MTETSRPTKVAPILAIAAPVRGEAPYLLEWVAWHRVMGIDAFLLADNGGDDGTSEMLAALAGRETGVVVFDWRGARALQLPFYVQALGVARRFATGLFLIDVDEFLRPQGRRATAREVALDWLTQPDLGAVALNWAVHGSAGREEAGKGLVTERFPRRAEQAFALNRHSKPFVRVEACAGPGEHPHVVRLDGGRYCAASGEDVRWDTTHVARGITAEVDWSNLRVDHYVLKSRREFETRRERGSATSAANRAARFSDTYFEHHDRNEVLEPVSANVLDAVRAEMARLRAVLPGLKGRD
jgi:hypothetical protein